MTLIDDTTREDIERKILKQIGDNPYTPWNNSSSKETREKVTQYLVNRTLDTAEKVLKDAVVSHFYSKEEEAYRQRLKNEVRAEIDDEQRKRTPTEAERTLLRNYTTEIEVHCRAHAVAAWERAEAAVKRIRTWPAWFAVAGILSASGCLAAHFLHFFLLHWDWIHWGVAAIPIIASIAVFGFQSDRNRDLGGIRQNMEAISSGYEAVAEIARRYRIVDADMVSTNQNLKSLVDSLDSSRQQLDNKFRAEPVRVQALKARYRVETLADDDPLGTDLKEFDRALDRSQKAETD